MEEEILFCILLLTCSGDIPKNSYNQTIMPEKETNQKNKMRRTLREEEKRIWTVATQDVTLLDPQKITEKTTSFSLRGARQNITENHGVPAQNADFLEEDVRWRGGMKGVLTRDNRYEKSSRQMGRAQHQRWQNGEEPFDARIDLHGLTQLVAHKRLVDFILQAHKNGNRSLLVITGKGRGIIRGAIGHWLEAPLLVDKILAVAQAQPKDGGEGALYILLRKAQRTRSTKKLS